MARDRPLICIIGLNACGKSTLLKALARILTSSSGRITRGGENIRTRSRRAYARTLAFLEQSGDVPPALTPRVIEDVFQVAADVVTDPFSGRPLVLPGRAYHRDAEGRKRSPKKTENNFKERCV